MTALKEREQRRKGDQSAVFKIVEGAVLKFDAA